MKDLSVSPIYIGSRIGAGQPGSRTGNQKMVQTRYIYKASPLTRHDWYRPAGNSDELELNQPYSFLDDLNYKAYLVLSLRKGRWWP
jgi:hypothetical protein